MGLFERQTLRDLLSQIQRQRWFPHRLSSQLLVFVGFTVASAAILASVFFTYTIVKHAKTELDENVLVVAKNIAAVSGSLIIGKEYTELEKILVLNAHFSYIESILIVDANGKVLSEVSKVNDHISPKFGTPATQPKWLDGAIDVATGAAVQSNLMKNLLPENLLLEVWYPVQAGSLLGSIRIRYRLEELNSLVREQWLQTVILALVVVLFMLGLLTLILRSPMRALRDASNFSARLEKSVGEQIPVYTGTSEIAELSISLNSLSSQLLYQTNQLREQIAQNQSILDNVVDGIITIDGLGTIRSFNLAATNIFGWSNNEVIGRNIRLLMPEPNRSQHDGYLQNYHQTGVAKVIGQITEVEGQRKDGTVFPMDLAISRSADHGEVIFIGIVRDITERRRLDRLKSEFVSTVSHELRTPLTSIYGSLKLVKGGVMGAIPDAALKLIAVAEKNSQRLILLINDLLDMEKLAAGKMDMMLVDADLVALVKQSMQENEAYAAVHNVQYQLGAHPAQVRVLVDASRLSQVLANILSNAAKFSGSSPQVDIRISSSDDMARVEITDHGDGIPIDFQHEIFGAFAQANNGNTRQQGGTGLGLKISKALIAAMQGEIGFTSDIGIGTTFWFSVHLVKTGGCE